MPIQYQVLMGSYTVEDFVKQIDDAYELKNDELQETGRGILIAPFQRAYKWHETDSPCIFFDSLNQNIFVMPVILVEIKKQTWIIDGQQRLATLYCYLKGYSPSTKKPIQWGDLIQAIKMAKEWEKKQKQSCCVAQFINNIQSKNISSPKSLVECPWKELEGNKFDKEKIAKTPIGYSLLFNTENTDDKNKTLIEIYDRINNQGIPLDVIDSLNAYAFYSNAVAILKKEYYKIAEYPRGEGSYNLYNIFLHTLAKIYIPKKFTGDEAEEGRHTIDFIRDLAKEKIVVNDFKNKLQCIVKWLSDQKNMMFLDNICGTGIYNNKIYQKFIKNNSDYHTVATSGEEVLLFGKLAPKVVLFPLLWAWFKEDRWLFDSLGSKFWLVKDDKFDEDNNHLDITDFLLKYIEEFMKNRSLDEEYEFEYEFFEGTYHLFCKMNPGICNG